jgi:hypothetical protein
MPLVAWAGPRTGPSAGGVAQAMGPDHGISGGKCYLWRVNSNYSSRRIPMLDKIASVY